MDEYIGGAITTNKPVPKMGLTGLVWTLPKNASHTIDIPFSYGFDEQCQFKKEIATGFEITSVTYHPNGVRLNVSVGAAVADGSYDLTVRFRGNVPVIISGIFSVVAAGGSASASDFVFLDEQEILGTLNESLIFGGCRAEIGGGGGFTPLPVIAQWEKIVGTSVPDANMSQFTQTGDLALRYDGSAPVTKKVMLTFDGQRGGTGVFTFRDFGFQIFKNGAPVVTRSLYSELYLRTQGFAYVQEVPLVTNDVIEPYVQNFESTDGFFTRNVQMTVLK